MVSNPAVKILAVEDDAVARAVLRQALKRLGHEAVEAGDGEAAWEVLQQEPVRIVVSNHADYMTHALLVGATHFYDKSTQLDELEATLIDLADARHRVC